MLGTSLPGEPVDTPVEAPGSVQSNGCGQGVVQHRRGLMGRLPQLQAEETHGVGQICHASE